VERSGTEVTRRRNWFRVRFLPFLSFFFPLFAFSHLCLLPLTVPHLMKLLRTPY
jgi:hypothetical protein